MIRSDLKASFTEGLSKWESDLMQSVEKAFEQAGNSTKAKVPTELKAFVILAVQQSIKYMPELWLPYTDSNDAGLLLRRALLRSFRDAAVFTSDQEDYELSVAGFAEAFLSLPCWLNPVKRHQR